MNLYEKLSGGLTPEQHRAESKSKAKQQRVKSKAESNYLTKDPATLQARKKAILPYLEFGTGVQGWGERGKDPNLNDLLWTLPVIAGTGVGAVKGVKDIYSRATTTPVWRGVRKHLVDEGKNIKGSKLYDEVLHTTRNPSIATDYATDPSLRFGGAKLGEVLKFRVPNKYFKEKGIIGPFQDEAEEIIFKKGLPQSMLQYAKKPKDFNPLDKLENFLYSFGRIKKFPKDAFGNDIIDVMIPKVKKQIDKVTDRRRDRAAKLHKGGMKRAYADDAPWYNLNSQLRFTNPQGTKEILKILNKEKKRPLKGDEIERLKYLGWKFDMPGLNDYNFLEKLDEAKKKLDKIPKLQKKAIMAGVRPGKPLYKKRIKSKKFDGIISAEGNVVEAQDAFERQMNYMNRPGYSGGRRIRDKRGDA